MMRMALATLLGTHALAGAALAHGQDRPSEEEATMSFELSEVEPESDERGSQPSPLDFAFGFAGFSRNFGYNDDLTGLRSYDLGFGPTLALKLRWYPAAHFASGFAANLGLELRGQTAFALDSAFSGTKFSTSAHALGAALRARLPVGKHELGAIAGFGQQSYAIDDATVGRRKLDPGVPSTAYAFARLGADARFAIDDFALTLGAAYLPAFSSGEVERMFPRATAAGFEAELVLSRALSSSFELQAGLGFQSFALALHPRLADVAAGRPIAGGAHDRYLWGTLGARFVWER